MAQDKGSTRPLKPKGKVKWKWLGRDILGEVVEVFFRSVTKKIKDKTIKRNGNLVNPAYLVRSQAGNLALKLHSELQTVEPAKERSQYVKPTIFAD